MSLRAPAPGGSYNDAYVDDVALVPRIAPLRGLVRAARRARARLRRAPRCSRRACGSTAARRARVRRRLPERDVRELRRRRHARPAPLGDPRRAPDRAAAGPDPPPAHPALAPRAAPRSARRTARPRVRRGARRAKASPAPVTAPVRIVRALMLLCRRRRQHADAHRHVRRRPSWSSTGGSRPSASRPPTSSARRCAACSSLRGLTFDGLDASIVSSTVPQLRPEWTAMAEPLPRPRDAGRRARG